MNDKAIPIAECTHFFKSYSSHASLVFLKLVRETATQQVFVSHERQEVRSRKGSGLTLQGRNRIEPVTPAVVELHRVRVRDAHIRKMVSYLSDFASRGEQGVAALTEDKRAGLHALLLASVKLITPEPHAHKTTE